MLLATLTASAQRFFNLTADEVRIDSLLPMFTHKLPLGSNYADSTYTISIQGRCGALSPHHFCSFTSVA